MNVSVMQPPQGCKRFVLCPFASDRSRSDLLMAAPIGRNKTHMTELRSTVRSELQHVHIGAVGVDRIYYIDSAEQIAEAGDCNFDCVNGVN